MARSVVVVNRYRDSVALLKIASELSRFDGVERVTVTMATAANLVVASDNGFRIDREHLGTVPSPNDVFVGVIGTDVATTDALEQARAMLLTSTSVPRTTGEQEAPRSIRSAVFDRRTQLSPPSLAAEHREPGVALISVPGPYAAAEAHKALHLGLHVMMFSDNVELADEVELKRIASKRNLLMMGPDCGTAMLNGVPLGFVNAVRRGPVAVIGASGTGMQEVMARLDQLGTGVSQAIGCGGRDLLQQVNAATMSDALRYIEADDQTNVVVLIAKAPHPDVIARVVEGTRVLIDRDVPVILSFTGLNPRSVNGIGLHVASSMANAADLAASLAGHSSQDLRTDQRLTDLLDGVSRWSTNRRLVGAFVGGTLCGEYNALVSVAADLEVSCTDFGDDEYTRSRPHPMIDPSVRDAAAIRALSDPSVGLLHFDIVLGYGATQHPLAGLIAALTAHHRSGADSPIVSCHVLGTDLDSQGRARVIEQLRAVGVYVFDTNAAAAHFAVSSRGHQP